MIINKAVLNRLPKDIQITAINDLLKAQKEGKSFTLFGKRKGVALSTYDTVKEAQDAMRKTWTNYDAKTGREITKDGLILDRILRGLGQKIISPLRPVVELKVLR